MDQGIETARGPGNAATMRKPADEVVIVAARRTPVGSFLGALGAEPAHRLGEVAIRQALADAGVEPDEVGEVVLGQVLTAAQGQNPARQAAMAAGIPKEVPAWGVNQVCGSGLRSVAVAARSIMAGDFAIAVAGGQESMSQAPHAQALRTGQRMGAVSLVDTMVHDGLRDAFGDIHMGVTAENIAREFQISRDEQDAFALRSQQRAAAARSGGRFGAEIAPVTVSTRKGDIEVAEDEYIRADASAEALAKLKPAFARDGTVTAGNASGLNDGAAALVLMSAAEAERRGAPVLARIAGFASAGVDPAMMGLGPVPAVRQLLDRLGWTMAEVDLVEANEAFAAQAIAVGRELGLDEERLNVNGGAIAIGHPIGASGARILVTLLHEMARREVRRGLATLCVGGGMGVALAVER